MIENNFLYKMSIDSLARKRWLKIISNFPPGGARHDIQSTDGSNLLHVTAFTGDLKLTQMMAGLGIDKQARDIEGWAPVHYACYYGHTEVAKW